MPRKHAVEPVRRAEGSDICLRNPPSSQGWVNIGGNRFVRSLERGHRALDDGPSVRHRQAKLDFRSAAESLLSCSIRPVKLEPKAMEAGVHGFMEDRGSDLRFRKVGIDGERELDQARVLVGKVRAAAGVAFNHDTSKIAAQATKVMRRVALDQAERLVETPQHVCSRYVRPSVTDDDRYAPDGGGGGEPWLRHIRNET